MSNNFYQALDLILKPLSRIYLCHNIVCYGGNGGAGGSGGGGGKCTIYSSNNKKGPFLRVCDFEMFLNGKAPHMKVIEENSYINADQYPLYEPDSFTKVREHIASLTTHKPQKSAKIYYHDEKGTNPVRLLDTKPAKIIIKRIMQPLHTENQYWFIRKRGLGNHFDIAYSRICCNGQFDNVCELTVFSDSVVLNRSVLTKEPNDKGEIVNKHMRDKSIYLGNMTGGKSQNKVVCQLITKRIAEIASTIQLDRLTDRVWKDKKSEGGISWDIEQPSHYR